MKEGKYESTETRGHSRQRRRRTFGNKSVALVLSLVLLVGGVIGGTVAWLTAKTDEVKNVFTTSDIGVTLEETTNTYKMIPGWTIPKDPKVTLEANSEACYVFVKIDEDLGAWDDNKAEDKFTDYLSYTVADGWTALTADKDGSALTGIYYRKVDTDIAKAGAYWYVLEGDTTTEANKNGYVTVSGDVTKEMMDELNVANAEKPTLSFQAAAVQLYKTNSDNNAETTTDEFTAAEAYDKIEWPADAGSSNP